VLDLSCDAAALTAVLVDIESVSGDEARIADLVESALAALPELKLVRDGNVVIARTERGALERVVLAGHLDTVPIADNVPSRLEGDRLYGCGSSDMKSGLAVMLRLAHLIGTGALTPTVDVTWVFYDCEEIEAVRNGLRRIALERPELLAGDLAILGEGTEGLINGGCQGTLRAEVRASGVRSHSAYSWQGVNAIHAAAPILDVLAGYEPRTVPVEGLIYREGLNAVGIAGGLAGNIVPDECVVTVNYRFAPDRSAAEAEAHVRELFAGFDVTVSDLASAARPGLDAPLAQRFAAAVGGEPQPKFGWTDVARFGELGIPALNFGPGDPNVAHTQGEYVLLSRVQAAEDVLVAFLSGSVGGGQ
jgi:succinyl-diaminopimelate desuccinylase